MRTNTVYTVVINFHISP